MIRRVSSLLLLMVLCTLLARPAFAQEFNWPSTFNGQPDFNFNREEIIKELQQKKEELGFEPFIANFEDLYEDRRVNPYVPKPRYRRTDTNEGDAATNPFLPSQLVDNEAVNLNAEDAEITGLPEYEVDLETLDLSLLTNEETLSETVIDVSDFERYLVRLVEKQDIEFKKPDLAKYDYSAQVQDIILQAISTAPVKYLILNDIRYSEGDQFLLTVKVAPEAKDIESIINQSMPDQKAVSEEDYKKYEALKAQALKTYEARVKKFIKDEEAGLHDVTVTVQSIEHRRVVLNIFGEEYPLSLKLLL